MLTHAWQCEERALFHPLPYPATACAHFLDLHGARSLVTPGLLAAREALAHSFQQQAMMCLYGASGTGKTFALGAVLCSYPPHLRCVLRLRSRPEPADLRAALHHALRLPSDPPVDPGVADALILAALDTEPRIVAVDEAQQLSPACFEYLRYLHDVLPQGLCVVLIAGEGGECVLRAQRMLASRTAVWQEITPLRPDHVPPAISRLHPVWQHTTPAVLRRLDARFARGRLRQWATLTHHTHRALTRTGAAAPTLALLERLADRIDPLPRR